MKRLRQVLALIGGLALVVVLGGAIAAPFLLRDAFSARKRPGALEATLARMARTWSVPRDARTRLNPVKMTAEAFMEARAHFADHCAQCHGNDGSGQTEMGKHSYPPAPDLRLPATQGMTDGEIFYWIQNGVRLTAMPAWGEGNHDDAESWKLVGFIRRLPTLSGEDVAAMQYLNPKSPEEWKELQEEESFLRGGEAPKPPESSHHH